MKNQRKIYKSGGVSIELNMQLPRKMSAQNVMASISRTLGTRNDAYGNKASNEIKLAGEESKDKLYEPKNRQKTFRVMIVIAYIICVSLAAIILSLYYAFIWDPKDNTRYAISQSRINITNKVECLNRTILIPLADKLQSNELNNDKIIKITSENNTELMEKFDKSIDEQLPILIEDNVKTIDEMNNDKTIVESSPIMPSLNINNNKLQSNNSNDTNFNQYNLPKR